MGMQAVQSCYVTIFNQGPKTNRSSACQVLFGLCLAYTGRDYCNRFSCDVLVGEIAPPTCNVNRETNNLSGWIWGYASKARNLVVICQRLCDLLGGGLNQQKQGCKHRNVGSRKGFFLKSGLILEAYHILQELHFGWGNQD